MKIDTTEADDYTVIGLEGDIDLSCSPEARKSMLDVLKSGKNLLVDLQKVTYIDSSGIAALVEGYQTAKKETRQFGLVGVSDAVMSVLEFARLDKVFPIYENVSAYERLGS